MANTIALIGNPNSGKTTVFNALTGSTQYVGNWPGVTVEKKEGKLLKDPSVTVLDLPGIYSLSPYTPEEVVSRNCLLQGEAGVIVDVIDASSIERSLYLTTQLLELKLPTLLLLNMMDVADRRRIQIDIERLSSAMHCPVYYATAHKNQGLDQAADAATQLIGTQAGSFVTPFSEDIERALSFIADEVSAQVPPHLLRFYSIKLFERDTDIMAALDLSKDIRARIVHIIADCEARLGDDSESLIISGRYAYIDQIVAQCVKKGRDENADVSQRIDRVLTGKYTALPLFALIMFLIYFISISTLGAWGNEWLGEVFFPEVLTPALERCLLQAGASNWLISLLCDGVVAGVGSVLSFLPQIILLFFLLSFLEDCGYMARIAFILDRILRRFGLSGKSIIPMLIGTGCSVPAIMSSRTIEHERDRKITIFTASFIPCSAKLPVIALISGALFGDQWWVAPSAYFVGVFSVLISGVILKKLGKQQDLSPFIMELPQYHLPAVKNLFRHTWERASSFVKKAGTVIFISSVVIWFLSNFSLRFQLCAPQDSILAQFGSFIAPVFMPLGFSDWPAVVATLTGIAAKENIVSTLSVLYGFAEGAGGAVLQSVFTPLSGYSFLLFNLLCVPCVAAIGAIARELRSARLTALAALYQTVYAYVIALIFYQGGLFIQTGALTTGAIAALMCLLSLLWLLLRPAPARQKGS